MAQAAGHSDILINKVLRQLDQVAALGEGQNLYDTNKAVYRLLRYGVKDKEGGSRHTAYCGTNWHSNSSEQSSFAIPYLNRDGLPVVIAL